MHLSSQGRDVTLCQTQTFVKLDAHAATALPPDWTRALHELP